MRLMTAKRTRYKQKKEAEQANKNEVFIWNTTKPEELKTRFASLKTIRIGSKAYDITGKPLNRRHKPVFIHSSELDALDKIMMGK